MTAPREQRMREREPISVVVIGPSAGMNGGIASVTRLMAEHAPAAWRLTMLPTQDGSRGARSLVRFARAIGGLVRARMSGRADIAHVHLSAGGSTLRKAVVVAVARLLGVPVVLHAHSGRYRDFFARLPRAYRGVLRALFRRVDRLVVLSEEWRPYYTAAFGLPPDRVQVLPNPVEIPRAPRARPADSSLSIVFLGRIAESKGAFDLLRAYAALPVATRASSTLVLAGDGNIDGARRLAAELGVADGVSVTGWLGRETCGALLQRAAVFALPSHQEGLPMALLEAMAAGLAVVTTPVGGIPSVVEDGVTGRLVAAGDVPGLAGALGELLGSRDLRARLGAAARRAVEPLDVAHCMAALDGMYATVRAERAAARKPARGAGVSAEGTEPRGGAGIERVRLLGSLVDSLTMDDAVARVEQLIAEGGTHRITVTNANKLWQVRRNARLRRIVEGSSLIVPEWAVVWGAKRLGTPLKGYVLGISLFRRLLDVAPRKGWSVYLVGARPEVVDALVATLRRERPGLRVVGHRHGFMSAEEEGAVAAEIARTRPDLLFVAMGSPRQEYWIEQHGPATGARVTLGVGGSFDVLAGFKPDTPSWARGHGLEWLYRLWLDPRNLWKRYLVTNSWFVWRVFSERLRRAFSRVPAR